MYKDLDKIKILLQDLGLDKEESEIYLYLLSKKDETVLDISRELKISRPQVYRSLNSMIEKGLVSVVGQMNKRRFEALSIKGLEHIVSQKKAQVDIMQNSLNVLFNNYSDLFASKDSGIKVVHYKGYEGLKTITWNSTRTKDIFRIFELNQDMTGFTDFDFAERVRMEFVRNGLKELRQITNLKKILPWTNFEEIVDLVEFRYLDPKVLIMNAEILVYNDVLAMYNLKNKELVGIEIYNQELADMQKKLFDFIWFQLKPLKIIDKRGGAKLLSDK